MARNTIVAGTTKQFLQDINENFEELYGLAKNITFGNSEPNNEDGNDGDIYIQY
jgi:hypothetical protein